MDIVTFFHRTRTVGLELSLMITKSRAWVQTMASDAAGDLIPLSPGFASMVQGHYIGGGGGRGAGEMGGLAVKSTGRSCK